MDRTRCIFCGIGEMRWGSDGCFSDFEWQDEGWVAYMTCCNCGATAEYYSERSQENMLFYKYEEIVEETPIVCWLCRSGHMGEVERISTEEFGREEGEVVFMRCDNENCCGTAEYMTNQEDSLQ